MANLFTFSFNFKIKMKKRIFHFCKKIAFLALIILLLDICIGKVLQFFYLKMKTGQSARITYSVTKATEEIIIFGSSRANHNYVPSIFEDSLQLSTYNCGIDGQEILFHYALLQSFKNRKTPQVVILDLNFDDFEKNTISYDRLYVLLPYYKMNDYIQPVVNLRSPFEKIKCESSLYRLNSFILPILVNNIVKRKEESSKGYLPLFKELDTNIIKPKDIAPPVLDTTKVRIFNNFIKECKKQNCKLFVFVSPIYKPKHLTSNTISIADSICKLENIPFTNYSNLKPFNNNINYFQDYLHLNHNGAQIYTRLIASEIKKRL